MKGLALFIFIFQIWTYIYSKDTTIPNYLAKQNKAKSRGILFLSFIYLFIRERSVLT